MPRGRKNSVVDFWRFVKKTRRCWLWIGPTAKGYGNFNFARLTPCGKIAAHRFAYLMFVGRIARGLLVCHKCDNPLCVKPSHLFLGTNSNNMLDALRKGRWTPMRHDHSKRRRAA